MDEITFNSQSNIFFGYTLEELDKAFQDTRYVFTLEEDGQTAVQELTELKDETFENVLKDVAIGTGVILLCVTVSALSGGLGAPAVAPALAEKEKIIATAGALFHLLTMVILWHKRILAPMVFCHSVLTDSESPAC